MIKKFFEKVCNSLNFNSDNSKENFKAVLEILKTEYILESERTKAIEKKANIFLSLLIAIISLTVPNIPLNKIKSTLTNLDCINLIQVTVIVGCLLLFLSLIFAILAFHYLTKIIKLKTKNRVDFIKIIKKADDKNLYKGLFNHYSQILKINIKENNKTAETFNNGEKYFRNFFFTLIFGIMMVTLIVE